MKWHQEKKMFGARCNGKGHIYHQRQKTRKITDLNAYVLSIFLYNSETWTIKSAREQRIRSTDFYLNIAPALPSPVPSTSSELLPFLMLHLSTDTFRNFAADLGPSFEADLGPSFAKCFWVFNFSSFLQEPNPNYSLGFSPAFSVCA